jgi:hypothetical protein
VADEASSSATVQSVRTVRTFAMEVSLLRVWCGMESHDTGVLVETIPGLSSTAMYLLPPKKKKGGGGGKAKKGTPRMPECTYGAACTRPKCIYRHPKLADVEQAKVEASRSGKVCLAYLAGLCTYGRSCRSRHPSTDEANELIAMFSQQLCRFGTMCQTEGCLYAHPEPEYHNGFQMDAASVMSAGAQSWVPMGSSAVEAPSWTPGHQSVNDPTLVPQQWPKAASSSVPAERETVPAGRFQNMSKEHKAAMLLGVKSLSIPVELWRDYTTRDSSVFHEIANPLARFGRVNEESPENCIDLHYIGKEEVNSVLDVVLPQYKNDTNIWIVTGSGHHRDGHQAMGVLFYSVVKYLKMNGYRFKTGIDAKGYMGACCMNPSAD